MMNTIAIDVASEVSCVCIIDSKGKIKHEQAVETRISHLKEIIEGVARPRMVVFEEGTQAAWLWSELQDVCDDILVCNPQSASILYRGNKSDKNDAQCLARGAYGNILKRVWHGGEELQNLKESARTYQCITEQNTRLKNQIKAVFRSSGIKIKEKAYNPDTRVEAIAMLSSPARQERVTLLGNMLDSVKKQQAAALKSMVRRARKNKMYKAVYSIDGFGPIFTSTFIAEIGDPSRFRTKRQLWSYVGLSVTTHDSSEYEVKNGVPVRKKRDTRTRGLTRNYNRILKGVLKHASHILSGTKWSAQYQQILKHSKNSSNAQLTLARKLACVALHCAKTGEKYEITKVFKTQ